MLIKLTGNKSALPVLVEADQIILAQEDNDPYQNDKPFTRITLAGDRHHTLQIDVEETTAEILEKIEDAEEGFVDE